MSEEGGGGGGCAEERERREKIRRRVKVVDAIDESLRRERENDERGDIV